jgi:hypothetical protein
MRIQVWCTSLLPAVREFVLVVLTAHLKALVRRLGAEEPLYVYFAMRHVLVILEEPLDLTEFVVRQITDALIIIVLRIVDMNADNLVVVLASISESGSN